MFKVLAPKGQGSRTYAIFELPGRQRLPGNSAFGAPFPFVFCCVCFTGGPERVFSAGSTALWHAQR